MLLGGCAITGPTDAPPPALPPKPAIDALDLIPQAPSPASSGFDHAAVEVVWPAALPTTGDPLVYGEAVAGTLLTWDTRTGLPTDAYTAPILADAPVDAAERAALIADVAAYLPAELVWQDLRGHAAWQRATAPTSPSPHRGRQSLPSPPAGSCPTGTAAVTSLALRHCYGHLAGQPVTDDHPIIFTVFCTCPPAAGHCQTLRISRRDQPLLRSGRPLHGDAVELLAVVPRTAGGGRCTW